VPDSVAAFRAELIGFALTLPEAWEDHPWGETVVKVRKKIFVFFGVGSSTHPGGVGCKLPTSAEHALTLPGAAPSGYGLGRAGWVNLQLAEPLPPLDLLTDWIEESYRTVAPKSLVAKLPSGPG
jgi:predicted DNA-binding protein (MmcQ/YjbR family)